MGTFKRLLVVGDTMALVYGHLISQQYVFKASVRVLRTLIHPSISNQHIFNKVSYVRVEKQTITFMHKEFLKKHGPRVEFKSSTTPPLLAKRKNLSQNVKPMGENYEKSHLLLILISRMSVGALPVES